MLGINPPAAVFEYHQSRAIECRIHKTDRRRDSTCCGCRLVRWADCASWSVSLRFNERPSEATHSSPRRFYAMCDGLYFSRVIGACDLCVPGTIGEKTP